MKFTTIYCIFTFAVAAASANQSSYPQGDTNISTRKVWGNEDLMYERDAWNGEDLVARAEQELGRRYLDPTYELSEREYEEIEDRQVAQVARLAVKGIMKIIEAIQGKINKDKDMRGKWTSALVDKLYNTYPKFNFVVCGLDHKTEFKGRQGHDWGHIHHEVNVSFRKTIGEGSFHRYGDGGYLNWAYYGNVVSTSNGGKDVVFTKRG